MPDLPVPADAIRAVVAALDANDRTAGIGRDESLFLRTVAKLGEELGEVMAAHIAWRGQNPRKPRGTLAAVLAELYDVALTALVAEASLGVPFDPMVGLLPEPPDGLGDGLGVLARTFGRVAFVLDGGQKPAFLAACLRNTARTALTIAAEASPTWAEDFVAHVETRTRRLVEAADVT